MPKIFIRYRKKQVILLAVVSLVLVITMGVRATAGHIAKNYIATLSWVIAGKLIVVDPGHGGEDPGALGRGGSYEKDIVLEVAKKLADVLRQGGAQVILTRETDVDLADLDEYNIYRRAVQDLSRRVAIANEHKADLFISVHVNSFPDPGEDGAQAFSQPGSEEGKKLATEIQREMNRFLANPGRLAKQADYYTLRESKMPGALVEIGFISNPREEKLMLDHDYQNKIAWSIYAGIVRYFSKSSTPVNSPPGKKR